jgi:hypothetical protein
MLVCPPACHRNLILNRVGRTLLQCYVQGVGTLNEIEAAADALPDEQKQQLLAFLAAKLGRTLESIGPNIELRRGAGLHAGAWELADDFDAPLPGEIWLGHDA